MQHATQFCFGVSENSESQISIHLYLIMPGNHAREAAGACL